MAAMMGQAPQATDKNRDRDKDMVLGGGFLGGGFKHFLFSPLFGEDVQFDEHIFRGVETTNWFQNVSSFLERNCPYNSGDGIQTINPTLGRGLDS